MTALETMAAFVADGIRGRVPTATRAVARLHVIDTVGAWVAGAHTAEGRALIAFRGQAADLATACAVARSSEIDNIHLASTTTPGAIVIPAALVIAAMRGQADTEAVCEAIVGGTEAMVRLGAAIGGPAILYRGIWPTYFVAPFGVAAVAARLCELDPRQSANALGLALALASAGVGRHNAATTARWFAIGNAVANGLAAARAAEQGFTSDLGLLDGGFLQGAYGITADIDAFTRDLGKRFALDDTSFKPWCAARQTMAATQALREVMTDGVAAESIASIAVHVPPPTLKMIDHGVTPGDRASHLTSVQYHLALAACDPEALHKRRAFSGSALTQRPRFHGQDFRRSRRGVAGTLPEGLAGSDHRAHVARRPGENRRPRAWRSAASFRRTRRLRQVLPRDRRARRGPRRSSSGAMPRGFRDTALARRFDRRDYPGRNIADG